MKFSSPTQFVQFIIPEFLFPLILVLAGFAIMFGFGKVARSWIKFVVTAALLSPFVQPLAMQVGQVVFAALPIWMPVLVVFLMFLWLMRVVGELLFGVEAWGHVMGEFLVWLFKLPFRFLVFLWHCLVGF